MMRIGLISDTHNYLDEAVFRHFEQCDEIWHGGDFGTSAIADRLKEFKPLKGVYGNIDGYDIRGIYPEKLVWNCEDVKGAAGNQGWHKQRTIVRFTIDGSNIKDCEVIELGRRGTV